MGVDVDEPWCQRHPRQVDLLGPGRGDRSHLGDTITRDRNVQLPPRRAHTVEHRSAAQHEVGGGTRRGRGTRPGRPSVGSFPTGAASCEADSQSSGRSGRTDQTTGLYEGATFQDESPSPSGPPSTLSYSTCRPHALGDRGDRLEFHQVYRETPSARRPSGPWALFFLAFLETPIHLWNSVLAPHPANLSAHWCPSLGEYPVFGGLT